MERQLTSLEVAELRTKPNGHAASANGANGTNGANGANAANGNGTNGAKGHKPDLRAGKLYEICLDASPAGGTWFSIADTSVRAGLAVLLFYRFLVLQPLALLRFAWGWNTLWYGRLIGALLTLYLPFLPVLFFGLVIYTRLNEALNPFVKVDWKMAGPGRVFFVRPDSFFASLMSFTYWPAVSTCDAVSAGFSAAAARGSASCESAAPANPKQASRRPSAPVRRTGAGGSTRAAGMSASRSDMSSCGKGSRRKFDRKFSHLRPGDRAGGPAFGSIECGLLQYSRQ